MIKRYRHPALRRQARVRFKTRGTEAKPRLSVFRSHRYVYAQVINDEKGVTLASAHGVEPDKVGEAVAQAALKKNVKQVVFDRGRYRFHGRISQLAAAARKAGLKF